MIMMMTMIYGGHVCADTGVDTKSQGPFLGLGVRKSPWDRGWGGHALYLGPTYNVEHSWLLNASRHLVTKECFVII